MMLQITHEPTHSNVKCSLRVLAPIQLDVGMKHIAREDEEAEKVGTSLVWCLGHLVLTMNGCLVPCCDFNHPLLSIPEIQVSLTAEEEAIHAPLEIVPDV